MTQSVKSVAARQRKPPSTRSGRKGIVLYFDLPVAAAIRRLEAQRELAYTTLSVKHIAYKLGFTDAGYFTRFFERETGATPSAWRAQAVTRQ